MLGVLQRSVAPGSETAHGTDQRGLDPLTLITQRNRPLVEIADLQYHLDLLGVFHKLHHAVDAAGVVVDPSTKMPIMSAAQGLFLARAQHRFDLWTTKILERPEREEGPLRPDELPPVDVLLLLHTYMLNPIAYREDVIRVYPCLARMGSFPWNVIHSQIDSTFEMTGTPAQISLWESATAEPFEPPKTTLDSDIADITCPHCLSSSKALWKTDDGRGLGEIGFNHVCLQCGLAIDSDALCVSKLLKDLSSGRPLAHTALDKDGMEEIESARDVSDDIGRSLDCPAATDGDYFGWKMSNIEKALLGGISEDDPLHIWLSYVLSAYAHFGKASIDLKAAVLRRGRFIQSMHEIQWAGPGSYFPGKEQALADAVASYERYFALTKTHTHGLVPTLDVDLAFHTHQLAGPTYADDCFSILGRFLNHDDTESNPETHHDNVLQSIDIWNHVYGETRPAPGGPRRCSNCKAIQPPPAPPSTRPKDNTGSLTDDSCEVLALSANASFDGSTLEPPSGLPTVGGPRGPPGYCSPDPPPPRPSAPTKPNNSDNRLHEIDIHTQASKDNPYERALPPLYLTSDSGSGGGSGGGGSGGGGGGGGGGSGGGGGGSGGGGGGGGGTNCANCTAPPPKPTKPKPHGDFLHLPRGPGAGGGGGGGPHTNCANCTAKPTKPKPNSSNIDLLHNSPYERGLPPLYLPRGPGGGGSGGGGVGPNGNCANCTAPKPGPHKPTKPKPGSSVTDLRHDNPYERGLPPLYQLRGPGGGGPHNNCANCTAIDPKPKPKPKPAS